MQVSVIMAVYNGERFLEETIESVLGQTFTDFEFVIVNDGSIDHSAEILDRYKRQDSRIVIVSQANCGIADSLNRAISISRSELLAHIDADDRALPSWLERQLDFLARHPDCSVVSSYAHLINSAGRRIGKSQNVVDVDKGRAEMNPNHFLDIVHSTVLMRKSDVLVTGGYRKGFLGVEDRDLWGRIVTAGMMIRCNSELLVEYRLHSGSITVSKLKKSEERRGINVNVVRRMRGEREFSPSETEEWFRSRPFAEKFTDQRRVFSGRYFRSASRHYADRRWLKFLWTFGVATAIRPVYVLRRAVSKLGGA